jgi:hypothetical protein
VASPIYRRPAGRRPAAVYRPAALSLFVPSPAVRNLSAGPLLARALLSRTLLAGALLAGALLAAILLGILILICHFDLFIDQGRTGIRPIRSCGLLVDGRDNANLPRVFYCREFKGNFLSRGGFAEELPTISIVTESGRGDSR